MSTQYISYSSAGGSGGVMIYSTFANFPATAPVGTLAVAADTNTLFMYETSMMWVTFVSTSSVLGPGPVANNTLVLFNGTDGNSIKGASGTGYVKIAAGVFAVEAAINLISSDVTGLTAKGDLLSYTGAATVILPVGTNAQILNADSTAASGLKWITNPAITALTGDATASGPGSAALTLATVNGNVGSFGTASAVSAFTVNAKGLITAAANTSIQIAESQVTNLVSDLASKQSATLTDSHLLVGNGSNVATDVAASGDLTLANTGAFTLATVNGNVGSFGSASSVGTFTVNAKGLTTAAASTSIQIAESQVTNLVSDLAAKQSTTLTSAHLLVGNGSNVATDVAASGDLTLANTGAFTVAKIQTTTVSGTTGSGNVVFSTSPTLVTPALGTPSALVGTNITGTAAGLTAGTVTTNANLTGPITSTGNATAVASQTGTGSTFVMNTSPTLVTPVIGAATGTSLSVSGQLTSTVATGTAPLVVSSTTQVANLNAATAGSATTATTATNANNVATTLVSANQAYFPLFVASSTNGNQAIDLTTGLTFNPSTNLLATTTFSGALTGTASGNTTYSANNHGVVLSSATNAMTVIAPNASTAFPLVSGGTGADPSWALLSIAGGGTGQSTASAAFGALSPLTTKGDVLTYSTVNARLPVGADGLVLTTDSTQTTGLKWSTASAGTVTSVALTVPAFLSVAGSPVTSSGTLAVSLSGTALPVANGGTGSTTAFTQGSVVFAGASGTYTQDNANFFWDATNHRLAIGNASATTPLQVGSTGGTGVITAFCYNTGTTSGTNSQGTGTSSVPAVASGTWTTTPANVSNTTSPSSVTGQWLRVGNVVTCSILITYSVTSAATLTRLDITPPTGANNTSSIVGTAVTDDSFTAGTVTGVGSLARVSYTSTATGTGSHAASAHFTYTVA